MVFYIANFEKKFKHPQVQNFAIILKEHSSEYYAAYDLLTVQQFDAIVNALCKFLSKVQPKHAKWFAIDKIFSRNFNELLEADHLKR